MPFDARAARRSVNRLRWSTACLAAIAAVALAWSSWPRPRQVNYPHLVMSARHDATLTHPYGDERHCATGDPPAVARVVDPASPAMLDWIREYGCAVCVTGFAVPNTPAEAQWLAEVGYPSRSERANFDALSRDEAERIASSTDIVALALLGDRRIREEQSDAMPPLERAAMLGSVYALYRLADILGRARPLTPDHQRAQALIRIAAMRGDHFALLEFPRRFARYGGTADEADGMAAIVLTRWHQIAMHCRWPALRIVPRPNVYLNLNTRIDR